jgi:ribosomal protein L10
MTAAEYRRLARWRSRRTGRSKIPASIWTAAGELAREHGVSRIAEVPGLEFTRAHQSSVSY